MKVKVNRVLTSGKYHVSFDVSDFSAVEVAKMQSFGVPGIKLRFTANNAPGSAVFPITQVSKRLDAIFNDEGGVWNMLTTSWLR
jgi:hypothetical protein